MKNYTPTMLATMEIIERLMVANNVPLEHIDTINDQLSSIDFSEDIKVIAQAIREN